MRYFIYLSYDGRNYHGWQVQPNGTSIQGELMRCMSLLCGVATEVIGAGRTDAEVNASQMVAHFDIDAPTAERLASHGQPIEQWLVHKLNRMLPADIAIHKVVQVVPDAHARFCATARTYHYHLALSKSPFLRHYSYRYPHPLDFALMNEAAAQLFRYSDFTSFSKLHTDTKTNICRIMQAEWRQVSPDEWVFTIKADRFLRNMVRAVVGTLIEVGRGAMTVEQFCKVIERKDRCQAGSSVPGNALFLCAVDYPEHIFRVTE